MSAIAVTSKRSEEVEPIIQKALDSLKACPDEETEIITEQNMAVGYAGSLVSTGKELSTLGSAEGHRIVLVATSGLLGEAELGSGSDTVSKRDVVGLHEAASRQRGGWSLIGTLEDRLVAGRDVVGQRPLFWGRSEEFTVVSSCRKALWSLEISDADYIPQGTILELGKGRNIEQKIGELPKSKPQTLTQDEAAAGLLIVLRESVRAIARYARRVGILFSGGLDSSLVAAAARDLGLETRLYTGAFEDSTDPVSAHRAADNLGLELEVIRVSVDETEDVLRRVIWEIESSDPIQVSVGMPIHAATALAVDRGETLLLSGSGSDELFGGYSKYQEAYRISGRDRVEDLMLEDVMSLGRRDLLRDGAIAESNRTQISAPFLDLELVKYGLGVPVNLKIETNANHQRKIVLRRAAEMMGIPREIAWMPKKAAQYSSKSLTVLRKLARREGLRLRGYLESTFNEIFKDFPSAQEIVNAS